MASDLGLATCLYQMVSLKISSALHLSRAAGCWAAGSWLPQPGGTGHQDPRHCLEDLFLCQINANFTEYLYSLNTEQIYHSLFHLYWFGGRKFIGKYLFFFFFNPKRVTKKNLPLTELSCPVSVLMGQWKFEVWTWNLAPWFGRDQGDNWLQTCLILARGILPGPFWEPLVPIHCHPMERDRTSLELAFLHLCTPRGVQRSYRTAREKS